MLKAPGDILFGSFLFLELGANPIRIISSVNHFEA
jgi:hypothetical protein